MKKKNWKLAILTPIFAIVSLTSIKAQSVATQLTKGTRRKEFSCWTTNSI